MTIRKAALNKDIQSNTLFSADTYNLCNKALEYPSIRKY